VCVDNIHRALGFAQKVSLRTYLEREFKDEPVDQAWRYGERVAKGRTRVRPLLVRLSTLETVVSREKSEIRYALIAPGAVSHAPTGEG
jgi:hypothetical protein